MDNDDVHGFKEQMLCEKDFLHRGIDRPHR